MRYAARSSQILYVTQDNHLRRVTVKDAKLVGDVAVAIPLAEGETLDAVRDDGKVVGVGSSSQGRFDAWDISGATPVKRFTLRAGVPGYAAGQSYAFSPDGRWLTGRSTTTVLWRIDEAEPVFVRNLAEIHAGSACESRFSSDGGRVVLGTALGFLHFWDTSGDAPRELSPFDPDSQLLTRLAHDPKSAHLVLSTGREWRLWDLSGGRPEPRGVLKSDWPFYPRYAGAGRWAQRAYDAAILFQVSRYADGEFTLVTPPVQKVNAAGVTSPDGRTLLLYTPVHVPAQHLEAWDVSADVPN